MADEIEEGSPGGIEDEGEISFTVSQKQTNNDVYVELRDTVGKLDKLKFKKKLSKIYEGSDEGLMHIRQSVYEYLIQQNEHTPKGVLIKRTNSGNSSAEEKLLEDIYVLYSCSEGTSDIAEVKNILSKKSHRNPAPGDTSSGVTGSDTGTHTVNGDINSLDVHTTTDLFALIVNMRDDVKSQLEKLTAKQNNEIKVMKLEIRQLKDELSEKNDQLSNIRNELERGNSEKNGMRHELKIQNEQIKEKDNEIKLLREEGEKYAKDIKKELKGIHMKVDIIKNSHIATTKRQETKDKYNGERMIRNPSGGTNTFNDVQDETDASDIEIGNNTYRYSDLETTQYDSHVIRSVSSSKNDKEQQLYSDVTRRQNVDCNEQHSAAGTTSFAHKYPTNPERNNSQSETNTDRSVYNIETVTTGYQFAGVGRKPRTKRIVISRVRGDTTEEHVIEKVKEYAVHKGVTLTFVRVLKKWPGRNGNAPTYTLRVNVVNDHYDKVTAQGFWPNNILARPWIPNAEREEHAEKVYSNRSYQNFY